ncbi:MAG TPA: hypothetical protein VM889_06660 [Candidatus Thermoplasmatota archaeon]|nr:hypothetical protein [Candidatus Thermoplasmatota archaeon]
MKIHLVLVSLLLIAPFAFGETTRETTLTDDYGPAIGQSNPFVTAAAQSANFVAPHDAIAVIVNVTDDLFVDTYFTICINKNVANPASARNCTSSDGDIEAGGINSVTLKAAVKEGENVLVFVFASYFDEDLNVAGGTFGEVKATFMKPVPPAA